VPFPLACASQRLCPHSLLWLPRPPAAGYSLAPLLSSTRSHITTADSTSSIRPRATQPSLSLSQMRRNHGHHPDPHRRSDPAPFSGFVPPCRMKPIFKNRKSRSIFRLDPPSCALPLKKSSLPRPRISSNRNHLLLPSPSPSHTALPPPSTPVHRLPHATHRRY
jgi:hypothetical protein